MPHPPAQPAYILRGHGAQVHSATFIRSNSRLVTGDADGWIIVWSLAIKRPVAVWKAHEGSILGAKAWGKERLITHGKDNKLIVWKLTEEDESLMSVVLPVDTPPEPRHQPWLLHVLHVNTMNFCSFAHCLVKPLGPGDEAEEELLIAVPNTMSSETVDIFHIPSTKRIHTVPNASTFKGGMVMAISIFYHPITNNLTVLAGYESGHASISQLLSPNWQLIYVSQPHKQPILSLDILSSNGNAASTNVFFTSSADALIAQHTIPSVTADDVISPTSVNSEPHKVVQTKHAGQQSLVVRNDGKILATAGWDSRIRVYSTKTMKELAVLKWHKDGCYAVAFADVDTQELSRASEAVEQVETEKALEKRVQYTSVKDERLWKAKNSHWLAAGSKDGKVSLWDIF